MERSRKPRDKAQDATVQHSAGKGLADRRKRRIVAQRREIDLMLRRINSALDEAEARADRLIANSK